MRSEVRKIASLQTNKNVRDQIDTLLDCKFTDYAKLTAALRNGENLKEFNAADYLDTNRIVQYVRSQAPANSLALDFAIDEVSLSHA